MRGCLHRLRPSIGCWDEMTEEGRSATRFDTFVGICCRRQYLPRLHLCSRNRRLPVITDFYLVVVQRARINSCKSLPPPIFFLRKFFFRGKGAEALLCPADSPLAASNTFHASHSPRKMMFEFGKLPINRVTLLNLARHVYCLSTTEVATYLELRSNTRFTGI